MNTALSEEMVRGMDNMLASTMARSSDPATSHAAARRAKSFAESHAGRILSELRFFKKHDATPTSKQLAEATGLTLVQVDRRLPELKAQGLARVVTNMDGEEASFEGYRFWEAV